MKRKILKIPSCNRLRQILSYNKKTGLLTWKDRPELRPNVNAKLRGKIAGYRSTTGYVTVGIDGKAYRAHRVIWMMVYGIDPGDWVDHKDRNGFNNVLKNLRKCTFTQNHGNSAIPSHNTSGYKGVSFRRGMFRAVIRFKYKQTDIGTFKSATDAALAYDEAALANFGEFAVLNFPRKKAA